MFDLSNPVDLIFALGPDILMIVGAMILLMWAAWRRESDVHQRAVGIGSLVLTLLVFALVVYFAMSGVEAGPGIIAVDNFRWMSNIVILLATAGTLALSIDYNRREGIFTAEAHVLVLFATSGMMLLVAARDLMMVFLGIELMSIAVYVLAGLNRRSAKAAEGSLKYFLLGAFSTAFLLYGIALIYGAAGSTNLEVLGARLVQAGLPISPLFIVGLALLVVGFGFKVAAAPFHMWAPDVYDGAPTPDTAYMAAAVKTASFVAFFRIFRESFLPLSEVWYMPIWWLAVITMVVGNFVALAQKNIKRMLAYSSIAHGGYILVALASGTTMGSWALLFYVLAYTLATIGAFGVVSALGTAGEKSMDVRDYSGMWNARPWMAVAMAIFMLALLGFPVFGGVGFMAKWSVVQASIQSPLPRGTSLAVVLVLTSVISAGYYLYVVMVMFMRPRPAATVAPVRTPMPTRLVIGVAAVLIIMLGLFPGRVIVWTQESGLLPPTYLSTSPPVAAVPSIR